MQKVYTLTLSTGAYAPSFPNLHQGIHNALARLKHKKKPPLHSRTRSNTKKKILSPHAKAGRVGLTHPQV